MLSTRAAHLSSRVVRKAIVASPALTAVRRRTNISARFVQSTAQTDRVSVRTVPHDYSGRFRQSPLPSDPISLRILLLVFSTHLVLNARWSATFASSPRLRTQPNLPSLPSSRSEVQSSTNSMTWPTLSPSSTELASTLLSSMALGLR